MPSAFAQLPRVFRIWPVSRERHAWPLAMAPCTVPLCPVVSLASVPGLEKVSPGGPASGLQMLTFYINRAGRGLTAKGRDELEKAKVVLSKQVHRRRESKRAA